MQVAKVKYLIQDEMCEKTFVMAMKTSIKQRQVLITLLGDELSRNQALQKELKTHQFTIQHSDQYLEKLVKDVNVTVVEFSNSAVADLSWLKKMKNEHPSVKFIVVDEDRSPDTVALAFCYGAADFFKKPLNEHLLSERIAALVS